MPVSDVEQVYQNAKLLPPQARRELLDFSEFLKQRYIATSTEPEMVSPEDPDYALAEELEDGELAPIEEYPELMDKLRKTKRGQRILRAFQHEN